MINGNVKLTTIIAYQDLYSLKTISNLISCYPISCDKLFIKQKFNRLKSYKVEILS